jgi:hypothetical protein
MTYKNYLRSYILDRFHIYHTRCYRNIHIVTIQIIHIHQGNDYGVLCWICKGDHCIPGGLIFETTRGANPGICNDCILCL